jgi:co-chaperonin GroES (HSP10)
LEQEKTDPKYLERFLALAGAASDTHTIVGDVILVQKIKHSERKTRSGIIIGVETSRRQAGSLSENRAQFVRVLAVGKGYYDEDTKETIPLDVKPGDIALVSELGVKWFSAFGDLDDYEPETVGLARESEIQLRFHGQAGYERAFYVLNQPVKEEVEQGSTGGQA